jgi:hypothetical protein
MPDSNAARVELSELASRLRMHPASLYARAVAIGVPVARAGRRSTVGIDDARRIEAALSSASADASERLLAIVRKHAAEVARKVLAEVSKSAVKISDDAVRAHAEAVVQSAAPDIVADYNELTR